MPFMERHVDFWWLAVTELSAMAYARRAQLLARILTKGRGSGDDGGRPDDGCAGT
ncbi:hypothetical protein ACTSKR_15360 [Chitinibacteraceae bacterium HSL-7]